MDDLKRSVYNAKKREKYASRSEEQKTEDKERRKLQRANATSEQKNQEPENQRLHENNTASQATAKLQKQQKRRMNESNEEREALNTADSARRKRLRLTVQSQTIKVAANADNFDETVVPQFSWGPMDAKCPYCDALHFKGEQNAKKKTFRTCCSHGVITSFDPTVQIQDEADTIVQFGIKPPVQIPPIIENLLFKDTPESKNFMKNIRSFNSALGFASFGGQISSMMAGGPYSFKVHGQVHHLTGPLHPNKSDTPKYAQLYFYDTDQANAIRMENPANSECKVTTLQMLDEFLRANNALAKSYKMLKDVEAAEKLKGNDTKNIMMSICTDKNLDKRRYNVACSNDIAVVFTDVDGEPPFNRDIKVYLHSEDKTRQISILHELLDSMTYPIFFPFGDPQWHVNIKTPNRKTHTRITQMEYYSYLLQVRDEFNVLLNGGKLTLQYICDSYCRMEANRLNYIKQHQKELRADKYVNLLDHLSRQAENHNTVVGRTIILPSSFTGSPRNMLQHYQDAMAMVGKLGPPTLFITMTFNPQSSVILDNLNDMQTPADRPDLIVRGMKLQVDEYVHDVMIKAIFGVVLGMVYVIEFQKRGLPHLHSLLILKNDKYNDPAEIDKIISAELPDKEKNPELYRIVTKNLIHGPCGTNNFNAPCMENSQCSKKYPRDFCEETSVQEGFPIYKRADDGKCVQKGNFTFTNKDVVPYNPYLTKKYNCHINVEACSSVKAVKYIYKYIYKGHDAADIKLSSEKSLDHDEISHHVNSRYVSAPEAMWRIYGYELQYQSHTIYRLDVHLPFEQSVTFKQGDEAKAVANAAEKDTKLLAFFKLNKVISDYKGTHYLYVDVPKYYTFNDSKREWNLRKRTTCDETVIGRMYTVNPLDQERYALRNLLLNVKGAKSYKELRTVDGVVCETFKEACIKLGIYEDDREWDLALTEAGTYQMARQVRCLFALILSHGPPQNPLQLWDKHKDNMIDDFCYLHCEDPNVDNIATSLALREIQDILILTGKYLKDFNLPEPTIMVASSVFETYNLEDEQVEFQKLYLLLNEQQKVVVNSVVETIQDSKFSKNCFMIDGPAGSGKTFVYKTIMSYVRGNQFNGEQGIALPVASTGIAATLLVGGRTSHSQFGVPMNVDNETCSRFIPGVNPDWERLKKSTIIIWDECTMTHRNILELVDRLLRDIMQNDIPFGGKVIVLGGDFRQCLPIVKHGNKTSIVEANLKNSKLWRHFKIFKLKSNMRAGGDIEFANWLTDLGEGKFNNVVKEMEDIVKIPSDFIVNGDLVTEIFNGINTDCINDFSNRAILCPLNEDAFSINLRVLELLEGNEKEYKSADSIVKECLDEEDNFPVEYLNSVTPSGMPPHILRLKKGAIIMLLRNINTKIGLCNGTRLIVKDMKPNLIVADVLTGRSKSKTVFIPRITTTSGDTDFPFVLQRRQFPIRLAFAMTINKSQGQSLDKVGLFLSKPVFGHGHLYVAFSRATAKCNVKVYIESTDKQGYLEGDGNGSYTLNCVYKEVL